jgi:hypothetical protein
MPQKQFRLRADQFRPLAEGHGACFATDMITVGGQRVGFMYRERPDKPPDCGWRFFSGTETQEYVDDPQNTMMYDVNTIANYDPEIVPFLDAPYPIAFARDERGRFVEVEPPEEPA